MNTANKITLLRIAIIPFFITFLFVWGKTGILVSLIIFMGASFSDWVDGYVARKKTEITTTGKIMDPVADKILAYSGFVCFVYLRIIPFWMVIIIMGRDLMVTALRVELAGKGQVVAASFLAKVKTVLEYVALLLAFAYLLFVPNVSQTVLAGWVYFIMGVATIFAVISGIQYFLKGREILAR